MLSDLDLLPIDPPTGPLGLLGLPRLWRNYAETFPRAAFEQRVTRMQTSLSDAVLVCDPDLIQEMLIDKADAFRRDRITVRSFAPVIGANALFLADGPDWRWQRRAVASAFRHDTLLSFVPIFAEAAERQIAHWRAVPRGEPVDVAAAMTRTTFDIIVDAMLGETLDAGRHSAALNANFQTIPWHILYDLLALPAWLPYPGRRGAMAGRDFLRGDVGRIVAARRARPSGRPDLLDLLLAARDPETGRTMTDAEVIANVLTFIAAGHEPTAIALTWTLWLIAKDQPVQQRLHEEAIAAADGGAIAAAQVERLPFTRQVLQEAMRLFPPAPGLSRQPKAAMQLGGIAIGRRTRVHVPIYALHRNVLLWDDPNGFDPDRFAPERSRARSRYAYLPFGSGARVCIGMNFAMIEAAIILATLVRALRFDAVPGHRPKPVPHLTLRPQGGMPLMVSER